jgi:Holliday junction DNA helicase RuvB
MPRPIKTFGSFVGQARAVKTLERLADGSLARQQPVPHLLLIGQAGVGKTTLARALAAKRGNVLQPTDRLTNFHEVAAGQGCGVAVHKALRAVPKNGFVLVDEAHALDPEGAEIPYPAMDDFVTFALTDSDRIDWGRRQPIAPMTVVLATNQPGRLPRALRSRALALELSAYSLRELTEIARRVAAQHAVKLTAQAARELAERSDRTPRMIQQLVGLLAATENTDGELSQDVVRQQLRELLGHDDDGVTPLQRRLLVLLAGCGGTARPEQLRTQLGLDGGYVRLDIEPSLAMRGLLNVRRDGLREITEKGLAAIAADLAAVADDIEDRESDK